MFPGSQMLAGFTDHKRNYTASNFSPVATIFNTPSGSGRWPGDEVNRLIGLNLTMRPARTPVFWRTHSAANFAFGLLERQRRLLWLPDTRVCRAFAIAMT